MRSLAPLTVLLMLAVCATKPAPPGISVLQLRERSFDNRLLTGFYAPEGDWRWTQRNFAASLDAPPVEIGRSQSGNYLSALVAGADRDTDAAATLRDALEEMLSASHTAERRSARDLQLHREVSRGGV